jgi:hypothetical protein
MQRPPHELETNLAQLVIEHRKLLTNLAAHQAALQKLDLAAMDEASRQQEASRLRIAALESRRRHIVTSLARVLKLPADATLTQIAQAMPDRREGLLKMRDELRALAEEVATKNKVAARIAGALLGHLNTAVRLIAGAVENAGVYTKHGSPQVPGRIGGIEALG